MQIQFTIHKKSFMPFISNKINMHDQLLYFLLNIQFQPTSKDYYSQISSKAKNFKQLIAFTIQ